MTSISVWYQCRNILPRETYPMVLIERPNQKGRYHFRVTKPSLSRLSKIANDFDTKDIYENGWSATGELQND